MRLALGAGGLQWERWDWTLTFRVPARPQALQDGRQWLDVALQLPALREKHILGVSIHANSATTTQKLMFDSHTCAPVRRTQC